MVYALLLVVHVLQEAREGESSHWLHTEGVAAGRYFISGSAECCPVKVEWEGEGSKEVWVAGSFTEWRQQPLTQRCVFGAAYKIIHIDVLQYHWYKMVFDI